jgi:hypothetical protein
MPHANAGKPAIHPAFVMGIELQMVIPQTQPIHL